MTAYEFKEAMKTNAMKQEFAALLNERNVETAEALIQAMADFAIAKGCDISSEKKKMGALTDDELENAAGGMWVDDTEFNQWKGLYEECYPGMFDPFVGSDSGRKKR